MPRKTPEHKRRELARLFRDLYPELSEADGQVVADKFAGVVERGLRDGWFFPGMSLRAQGRRRTAISQRLQQLRKSHGLTLEQLSARIGWSVSKLTRIETSEVGINRADLEFLARNAYRINDRTQIAALLKLAGYSDSAG